MSEQYRDPYQRTPINGIFFKNLHGNDALSQPPASVPLVEIVESPAVVPGAEESSSVVLVETVADESSVPATDESSSTAPVAAEGSTADAPPAAPEIVPPAE